MNDLINPGRRNLMTGAAAAAALSTVTLWPSRTQAQSVGDTLIIGQTNDILSLDPAFRGDTVTGVVQRHIYSGVLTRMPDMSVGPGAATSFERVTPTKWRLRLREGMNFSNGEPVNAEAVQYTIARLNADETKSPIRGFFANLKKVEVESPYVLTIDTDGPDALFKARMTNLQLVPPKYTAAAGAKFAEAPIGSGPYVFDHWRRNEEVVLNANPRYGGPDKAKYRRLVFRPIPEEIARITAVKTGAAHVVASISPSQADNLGGSSGVQVLRSKSNLVMVVQFNKMAAPAQDPRFRRAIALAINRDEIIRGLMKGYADPVTTIYGEAIQSVPKDIRGDFPYDPAQAKQIIEALGIKDQEIELSGAAGRVTLDRELALLIGAQLRRVGLNVKVRTQEYGSFTSDIKTNRTGPIFIMPHGNIWMDPLPQIFAFMYSSGFLSGWRDPDLDAMYDKANTADGDERTKLVGGLIGKMHDDVIAVPLFAHQALYGAAPALKWRPRADTLIIAEEIS